MASLFLLFFTNKTYQNKKIKYLGRTKTGGLKELNTNHLILTIFNIHFY